MNADLLRNLSPYKKIAYNLLKTTSFDHLNYTLSTRMHGIPVFWKMQNQKQYDWLRRNLPESFQAPIDVREAVQIKWYEPAEMEPSLDLNWGSESDSDFYVESDDFVHQRDFLAQNIRGAWKLVAPVKPSDGVFNFLRFLIPKYLMTMNKYVFHSSSIIDKKNRVSLFLGHSGAGKTTISSFADESRILGDDMICLYLRDSKLWAEPVFLGQSLGLESIGRGPFEVKNAFMLQKGAENQARVTKSGALLLMFSICGIEWEKLPYDDQKRVLRFVEIASRKIQFYNLEFEKSASAIDYVDQL